MLFGFAKEIITPCVKTPLACCPPHERLYLGIHDDVFVRTCYFAGNEKMLIVAFDLLFHNDALYEKIINYASEKYGIPRETILVNYTHAHTAPAVYGYMDFLVSDEYEDSLFKHAVICIERAMTNLMEGDAWYINVPCDWAISRRRINNGQCGGIEPSQDNVREKTMDIIKFTDSNGKIRGIISSYGVHPVHYPGESAISGEYPSRLCALLECEYYGAYAMFLQGAGATSRPRTTVYGSVFLSRCSYEDVDTLATALFKIIKSSLGQNRFIPLDLNIKGVTERIKLELLVLPKQEIIKEREKSIGYVQNMNINNIIENYEKLDDFISLRVGMIRLTEDIFICHMGGETSYEIKALLLNVFQDKKIIFIGYTDSCLYIPTDKMISEGGYEVNSYIEFGKPGALKPGIDAKITNSFINMYKNLRSKI